MHRTPDGYTGPGPEIRNAHKARPCEHRFQTPVPIRARIVWDGDGAIEWIETVAAGWSGHLVYVDAMPLRGRGYRINYVWLDASDVERI